MALKVSIQSNVQAALDDINRLKKALHEAGKAGKDLGKIELDNSQLGAAADQFDRIRDNFYAMKRDSEMRRVMDMAGRHGFDKNDPLSYVDKIRGFYSSSTKGADLQAKFTQNLSGGLGSGDVLNGGNLAAEAVQRSSGMPGASLLGRMGRSAWGTAASTIGIAAGMAGMGSIAGGLYTAFREKTSLGASTETLQRHLTSGQDFGELQSGIRELAKSLQITSSEAGKLAEEFAHASGAGNMAFGLAADAGQFGRGLGMDPSASAGLFGRAALLGVGQDKTSQREFAGLLANTIGSSHMFARSEQVMEDLVGHIGDIATKEGRTASSGEMSKFAGLLSSLYQVDALRSGGAQGIMAGLSNMGGGGDLVKDMFAWSAFGRAANQDYITMEAFKDASPFATVKDITGAGSEDTTKLDLAWTEAKRQAAWLPGGNAKTRRAYMLKLLTGMKMPLSEAAADSLDRMQANEGGFGQFKSWLGDKNIDVNTLNPEGLGNLAKLYEAGKRKSTYDYQNMAKEYANDSKTSQPDRERLRKLLEGDPAELMKELPSIVARTGASGNEAEAARVATTNLTNALEQNIGPPLRDLVTWMSGSGAGLIAKVGAGLETIPEHLDDLTSAIKTHVPALTGWLGKLGGYLGIGTAEASMGQLGGGTFGGGAAIREPTLGDRMSYNFRRMTGKSLAGDTYLRTHIAKLEQERGIPAGTLAKIMMQESSGENRGYHYKDGAYNPEHSDYGLFGIKKDYTGKDPGYGIKPLAGTSPEEQARFAADYLAKAIEKTGSVESGIAAYHTGIGGWQKGDPKTIKDGRDYVGYVKGKSLPPTNGEEYLSSMGGRMTDPEKFLLGHLTAGKGEESVSGLRDSFSAQLAAMIRGAPDDIAKDIQILSGYRSSSHQAKLYRDAVKKYGAKGARKWVAPPGRSRHNHGLAVDLVQNKKALDWVHEHAGEYGLGFPMGHEPWHLEPLSRSGRVPIVDAPKTPVDMDRAVRDMTTPNQANARVDGHHTLDIVMRNAEGKVFHTRRGLALSEPQVFGSDGARKVWNDTATLPAHN